MNCVVGVLGPMFPVPISLHQSAWLYLPRIMVSSHHVELTTCFCSNTEHRRGHSAKRSVGKDGIGICVRVHSHV